MGSFLALWVVLYGFVQAGAPALLRKGHHGRGPQGSSARNWALLLAGFPAGIALALIYGLDPAMSLIIGLFAFGAVFAINSAVHSYLILAYSDHNKVAMNVGFYYMANAAGRYRAIRLGLSDAWARGMSVVVDSVCPCGCTHLIQAAGGTGRSGTGHGFACMNHQMTHV